MSAVTWNTQSAPLLRVRSYIRCPPSTLPPIFPSPSFQGPAPTETAHPARGCPGLPRAARSVSSGRLFLCKMAPQRGLRAGSPVPASQGDRLQCHRDQLLAGAGCSRDHLFTGCGRARSCQRNDLGGSAWVALATSKQGPTAPLRGAAPELNLFWDEGVRRGQGARGHHSRHLCSDR